MTQFDLINSPHQSSRGGHRPELIVCHIADGTYAGTKAWFMQPASVTSSHFIVGQDGRICQCVPLNQMAWCNGTDATGGTKDYRRSPLEIVQTLGGNANQYSVSIEFEGYYSQTQGSLTPDQLSAGVELIKHIRDEVTRLYNHTIPLDRRYIVGHNEITPVTRPNCPGQQFPWSTLMAQLNDAPASALYRVQLGAFKDRQNATDFMKSQVLAAGITSFLTFNEKTQLFHVQVGAFANRDNADNYAQHVHGLGFEAFVTVSG
jgi:N-acetyl-anhydromuramyl-L-alanine amidase AmpD